MKWAELTPKHNGKKASVSIKSTKKSPDVGQGPYFGIIQFKNKSEVPLLNCGLTLEWFAGYWDVTILD